MTSSLTYDIDPSINFQPLVLMHIGNVVTVAKIMDTTHILPDDLFSLVEAMIFHFILAVRLAIKLSFS
jgi:hypothetical protein